MFVRINKTPLKVLISVKMEEHGFHLADKFEWNTKIKFRKNTNKITMDDRRENGLITAADGK